MNPERLFLDHLDVIDQVVLFIARRHHLRPDEAEELASAVRLKIIDNEYEVLRMFRGGSSLRTYLTAVVQRHFLDTRIAQWGKWRPCAQARRMGPTAVLLDRMLSRDGLPVEEAVETLCSNHRVGASRDQLLAIARQLPVRPRRRFSGPDELDTLPAGAATESQTELNNAVTEADRIEAALSEAISGLDAENRLILKMRFRDNLPLSQIARVLGLDQKPLYRRLEHVIRTLRQALEARGVSRDQVAAIVGHPATDLSPVMGGGQIGNSNSGPSYE